MYVGTLVALMASLRRCAGPFSSGCPNADSSMNPATSSSTSSLLFFLFFPVTVVTEVAPVAQLARLLGFW